MPYQMQMMPRPLGRTMQPPRHAPSMPPPSIELTRHGPLYQLRQLVGSAPMVYELSDSDISEEHEAFLSCVGAYKVSRGTPITATLGPTSTPFHNHTHSTFLHIALDIMFDFEIDWTTEEDRRRRRPKASTIHGWLRMWRGTFAGNERVRQKGRHEMKLARAIRKHDRKKAQAASGNGGPFSFFRLGSLSNRRNAQVAAPQPQRHRSNGSRHYRSGSQSHHTPRPTPAKRQSNSSSGANKGHPARGHSHDRPGPTRHRSSHSVKSKTRPSRHASGRR